MSARDLEGSLARDGIVLEPDQRQAVEEIIAGARNVHAIPLRTAAEVDDLAGIVDQAPVRFERRPLAQRGACLISIVLCVCAG